MDQLPIISSCMTNTQVTTTQVITTQITTSRVIFSTGDQSTKDNREITNSAAPESTLSYLRKFRHQHRFMTNKQDSEAADANGVSDEHENSEKLPYSRVSVICSNRNMSMVTQGDRLGDIIEPKIETQTSKHCPQSLKHFSQTLQQSPQSPTSNTIDCPICSALAVDHLHYGGLACFSCKAFFRRVVVMHNNRPTRCRQGDGLCVLTLGKRNNCPSCRFQRCLASGMKPSLVISSKNNKHSMVISSKNNKHTEKEASKSEDNQTKSRHAVDVSKPDFEIDMLKQILKHHRLVISQTASVNLSTIPNNLLSQLQLRVLEETEGVAKGQEDVLAIAKLELSFLLAKDCVVFFTDSLSVEQLLGAEMEDINPAFIFTSVQEFFVQLVVYFLKNCQLFQSLTWACQARLLRKNIADVSVLMMVLCYEKNSQVFRWGLGSKDLASVRKVQNNAEQIVTIDQATLAKYLNEKIAAEIFKAVSSLSQFDIPGHVLIILILISIFSRDGVLMEKQYKVDAARNYYQQLLFRYMKKTHPENQCSRLMALLQRTLKTVKDFAEKIRGYEVTSVRIS